MPFFPEYSGPVHSAVHNGRLPADILHNINFAAFRPTHGGNIVAEHPESWPHALSRRSFHPDLDLSVLHAEFSFCFYASGSEAARTCFNCAYNQMTVTVLKYVFGTSRIHLEFMIAPATTSQIKSPFRRVGRRAFMVIEFIAPHQFPTARGQKRQARDEESQSELTQTEAPSDS